MTSREITFDGRDGHKLAARLDLPSGGRRAAALFAHCFTCAMKSHAATCVTAARAAQGIATLRFDFTGLGGSEGDFVAAADYLRDTIGVSAGVPAILIGRSLGRAAIRNAAPMIPDARRARASVLAGAL